MASEERVEAWQATVARCGLAARALNAAVALYHSGGQDADEAWRAVEAARRAFSKATAREAEAWRLAIGPEEQVEIPGMERRRRRAKPTAQVEH